MRLGWAPEYAGSCAESQHSREASPDERRRIDERAMRSALDDCLKQLVFPGTIYEESPRKESENHYCIVHTEQSRRKTSWKRRGYLFNPGMS